jgi:hypothetical protein
MDIIRGRAAVVTIVCQRASINRTGFGLGVRRARSEETKPLQMPTTREGYRSMGAKEATYL